jgi:hypothetical protein
VGTECVAQKALAIAMGFLKRGIDLSEIIEGQLYGESAQVFLQAMQLRRAGYRHNPRLAKTKEWTSSR